MFPVPAFSKKEDDKAKTSSGFTKKKDDQTSQPPDSPLEPTFQNFGSFKSAETFGGNKTKMGMFPLNSAASMAGNPKSPVMGSM